MTNIVTAENFAGTFSSHRKIAITDISDETVPAGTIVATLEGHWTCAEESRIARDNQGNVYPIAESIYRASYERLS